MIGSVGQIRFLLNILLGVLRETVAWKMYVCLENSRVKNLRARARNRLPYHPPIPRLFLQISLREIHPINRQERLRINHLGLLHALRCGKVFRSHSLSFGVEELAEERAARTSDGYRCGGACGRSAPPPMGWSLSVTSPVSRGAEPPSGARTQAGMCSPCCPTVPVNKGVFFESPTMSFPGVYYSSSRNPMAGESWNCVRTAYQ